MLLTGVRQRVGRGIICGNIDLCGSGPHTLLIAGTEQMFEKVVIGFTAPYQYNALFAVALVLSPCFHFVYWNIVHKYSVCVSSMWDCKFGRELWCQTSLLTLRGLPVGLWVQGITQS